MWGTRCNLEKDRGMKDYKVMGILSPSTVKKDRKLKDFHFSSVCEEGESPHTFRWLGPSKPEFYGVYNGS